MDILIQARGQVAELEISGLIGDNSNTREVITTHALLGPALEELCRSGVNDIIVNIRSLGGSLAEAFMIYDAIRLSPARITTRCYGFVASAATVITQAASPGLREISSNSFYLIHCSRCESEGNSSAHDRSSDLLKLSDRSIAWLYSRHGGHNEDYYLALMGINDGEGEWLLPEKVLDAGLADSIIGIDKVRNDLPGPEATRINKNEIIMEKNLKWEALMKLLGLSRQKKDDDGSNGQSSCDSASADHAEMPDQNVLITALSHRVESLEQELRRRAALPTVSSISEDPFDEEMRSDGNHAAYSEDLRKLKRTNNQ